MYFFIFCLWILNVSLPGDVRYLHAAAAAKSLQSCPTLCDPIDGSPPGSPVPGILQARPLEWVAISFSNLWKWKGKVKSLSHVRLLATPWTAAYQAPPSMGFSRQEDWSGVPLPSPTTCIHGVLFCIPSLKWVRFREWIYSTPRKSVNFFHLKYDKNPMFSLKLSRTLNDIPRDRTLPLHSPPPSCLY